MASLSNLSTRQTDLALNLGEIKKERWSADRLAAWNSAGERGVASSNDKPGLFHLSQSSAKAQRGRAAPHDPGLAQLSPTGGIDASEMWVVRGQALGLLTGQLIGLRIEDQWPT